MQWEISLTIAKNLLAIVKTSHCYNTKGLLKYLKLLA